ncbi:MAG: DUF3179 domain-containing protein [Anaerolineales bacterium]|nr:DUF3179 domain-containing protein [Anaerolineales bacterium]
MCNLLIPLKGIRFLHTICNTTSESNVQTESATAADPDNHPADCADPFNGINIRFTSDVWTAENLARYVGAEIVEPTSGLKTNFCQHSGDYSDILSGGPPPDGIPPIDNPTFEPIAKGDEWLVDAQPVIALAIGDEAKALSAGYSDPPRDCQ